MADPKQRGLPRRSFLRSTLYLVALAAGACDFGESTRTGGRDSGSLRASDLAIAALAEGFARSQPDAAARIVRGIDSQLSPPAGGPATPASKADLARAHLLRREALADELARGDVVLLDGWVLARSEAEFAIFLDGLARP